MLIPILAAFASLGGGGTLLWYYSLSDREKKQADYLAEQYALQLYDLAVEQLSAAQAAHVHGLVKGHFQNN